MMMYEGGGYQGDRGGRGGGRGGRGGGAGHGGSGRDGDWSCPNPGYIFDSTIFFKLFSNDPLALWFCILNILDDETGYICLAKFCSH